MLDKSWRDALVHLGDGISCTPLLSVITLDGMSSQNDFKMIVDEVINLYQGAIRTIAANA